MILLDELDHRFGCGSYYRIAAEGGDGQPFHGICYFRQRHSQADGQTVGQALSGRDDIWLDSILLDAKPLVTGAAPACLHLVADEYAAVLSHDVSDNSE